VCVVRGDGVEMATGKEEVEEELQQDVAEIAETSDGDEDSQRHEAYPSWGRSTSWSISPFDADEEEDEEVSDDNVDEGYHEDESIDSGDDTDAPNTPSPTNRHRTDTGPALSGFRRIRSAMSLVIPDPIQIPPPPLTSRNHKRTRSHHMLRAKDGSIPEPSTARRERPSHIPLPPSTMPGKQSLPPSPSVRRRVSSASHPDISNLVFTWNNSGPANQTLMYAPANRRDHPE
jgi:hypothetical protein